MPIRTFLALPLEEGIVSKLVKVQHVLMDAGAKVRWVDHENLHVTVKFLGYVQDKHLNDVCQAAKEVAQAVDPFDFTVRGISAVPPTGQLRMVWVHIDDHGGAMAKLNEVAEKVFAGLGFKQENRQFRPHLTLGRVKGGLNVDKLRAAAAEFAEEDFGIQGADELIVFSSRLAHEGPEYQPLATIGLGGE